MKASTLYARISNEFWKRLLSWADESWLPSEGIHTAQLAKCANFPLILHNSVPKRERVKEKILRKYGKRKIHDGRFLTEFTTML